MPTRFHQTRRSLCTPPYQSPPEWQSSPSRHTDLGIWLELSRAAALCDRSPSTVTEQSH